MPQDANTKRRRIGLVITLLVNILIVGYIAFTEFKPGSQDVEQVSITDIRLIYLLFGVLCFGAAVLADYLKYRRMLMLTEGRFDRKGAIECALLGKYYDNVTPFGAGGQPFQIHYLRKRGYSKGTSAAAPAMGFFTQQIAFVIAGIVVFVANRTALQSIPLLNITAYIGLVMYALLPMAILAMALFPRPFNAAVRGGVKLLGKLHIVKDVEATIQKSISALDEYVQCLRLFTKHPIVFIKLIFLSLMYQTAILSIPFFMIRAFGGTGDWWTVFSLVVYIYAAITIVPTPGNAGAAEGSFYAVFSALEGGMLFWAMIAWRLLVYYSWLICGLIVIARGASRNKPRYKLPPQEGPLNCAVFTDLFYPSVDGVVRTVDAYATHLTELGHKVCVVCPDEGSDKPIPPKDYDVFKLRSLHIPGFAFTVPLGFATKQIKQAFNKRPPDVIHAHSPFCAGRLALRMGRKYKAPVVATFHSKYYDDAYNMTHSRLLSKIMVDVVVDFYIKADIVWACSKSTAQTLRSYGYNGEIHVMENGVELNDMPERRELPKAAEDAKREFGLPEGKKTLLFVGQLIWQKNLKLILDTLKLLVERDPSYFLVVAGAGYNGEAIEAYANELGLAEHTKFLGRITDRRLLCGVYELADIFFFPSLYDNAPLVVREAAAVGLPSLLTEGSNSAEVVEDGVNGYTAGHTPEEMAERIQRAFNDTANPIKAVGERAAETIPESWASIVERATVAYRSCSYSGHNAELNKLFGDTGAADEY